MTGPIDVIGSRRDGVGQHEESPEQQAKQSMQIPVRENTIQVMCLGDCGYNMTFHCNLRKFFDAGDDGRSTRVFQKQAVPGYESSSARFNGSATWGLLP